MMLFFMISNNLKSTSQQSTIKSFINFNSISQNNYKPSEITKQLAQAKEKKRISKVSWWKVEEKQKHTNEVAKNDYKHIVRKMCNFRAFWRI